MHFLFKGTTEFMRTICLRFSAEVATVSKYGNHFVLFDANGRELGGGYEYVIVAVPLHQKQSLQIDGELFVPHLFA